MLTSPNYSEDDDEYPKNFDGFQRIQVPVGSTIWMQFTDFDLGTEGDFVVVTDKDGTILGHFDEENSHDDWEEFESKTNMVEVRFHTDDSFADDGWQLQWGEFRLTLLLFTVDIDRNCWGGGEQAKERSFDVSQLSTTLSKQTRLYSDHQSCRGQDCLHRLHQLQHRTRI